MKRNTKIITPEHAVLDSALEKRTELFIEYFHRERVAHVIVFHVTLRRVHVDGSNLRLLEPKAVNVILEPQTCWEEWRQTVTIIVGSDPAIHPQIIVDHDRAKVHHYIHVVLLISIDP